MCGGKRGDNKRLETEAIMEELRLPAVEGFWNCPATISVMEELRLPSPILIFKTTITVSYPFLRLEAWLGARTYL